MKYLFENLIKFNLILGGLCLIRRRFENVLYRLLYVIFFVLLTSSVEFLLLCLNLICVYVKQRQLINDTLTDLIIQVLQIQAFSYLNY